MRYVSTRGGTAPLRFQEAVLEGLAADGGLLMPERLPDVRTDLASWRGLSFAELGARVMANFIDDIPPTALTDLLIRSYRDFDHPEVTPLVELDDGLHVLELFHGPTLAFKDIALQFLGNLFHRILTARGTTMNILGATSGDTGSAAIAGVRAKTGLAIFVMYPNGRTSALQELQMTSVLDANVHCLAIDGSFDDCQAMMKQIFNDLPFKSDYRLGAVNSVNWARVLAQIVYYVHACLALDASDDRKVSFSVPTGNFGDIFAGYLAMEMGLPIERLILATNDNDILSVFFNTGVYRRGDVHFTISPSMDIQVASNFERYLYLKTGRDSEVLKRFMTDFTRNGEAQLATRGSVDRRIVAGAVTTAETLATIRDTYQRCAYVVDPHTAVGIAAARRLSPGKGLDRRAPVVCLATAHPAKFPESVDKAIGKPVARHPRLDALKGAPTRKTELPADVAAVAEYVRRHAI
jgi:threonine synthase